MINFKSCKLTAAVIAVATPACAAPAPDAKLWSGSWKLNVAKSTFTASDFSEKSETRSYAIAGKRVTMRSSFTTGAGKALKWSYAAIWDGKSYPVIGNSNADHILLMPISGREVKSRTLLHGKVSATSTATVSADGKELTIMRSILTAKGGPSHDTLVYDRAR